MISKYIRMQDKKQTFLTLRTSLKKLPLVASGRRSLSFIKSTTQPSPISCKHNTAHKHTGTTQLTNTPVQHSSQTHRYNTAHKHTGTTQLTNTPVQHSSQTHRYNTAHKHNN